MQSLSIISVNIWQILISLANLVILTVIIKKFLFQPVKKMLDARKETIDGNYARAEQAEKEANEHKDHYEAAMAAAKQTTDQMISDAAKVAERRKQEIEAEARDQAAAIRKQAEEDARMEKEKAQDDMKREIAEVSTKLTEKLLEREVTAKDHEEMIDHFLEEL